MADLGRQGSSDSNNSSSDGGGGLVSGPAKERLKVPGEEELQLLAKLEEANRYYYTPGFYADGYIVFAFPFVRSYVR